MLARMVLLNEVMPPMTAATRAKESVWGPSVVRSPADSALAGDQDDGERDSAAASAHTMVETILGLMLDKRASCGLLAQALTVLPMRRPVEEPGQRDEGHRDDDQDRKIRTSDGDAGHRPHAVDGARVVHAEFGRAAGS